MQAVVTDPQSPGRLNTRDAATPAATAGHAIVRVHASSINRGELRLIATRANGWAPGQDVTGVIESAAPDGGPRVGTRIVGLAEGGAWSEFVAVPVERIAPVPDNVDFVQGACLPVAGLTALRALRALRDVTGRELLVTGANGGVGNVAVQLARDAGAFVTALARRPLAVDGIRVIQALNDETRFDRVIDGVGGTVLGDAVGHLRPHAKVVTFAGAEPAAIGLGTVKGSPATIEILFVYGAPGRFDEDLATLARFVSAGHLKPQVHRVFPIDQINDALALQEAGGVNGKIVLTR